MKAHWVILRRAASEIAFREMGLVPQHRRNDVFPYAPDTIRTRLRVRDPGVSLVSLDAALCGFQTQVDVAREGHGVKEPGSGVLSDQKAFARLCHDCLQELVNKKIIRRTRAGGVRCRRRHTPDFRDVKKRMVRSLAAAALALVLALGESSITAPLAHAKSIVSIDTSGPFMYIRNLPAGGDACARLDPVFACTDTFQDGTVLGRARDGYTKSDVRSHARKQFHGDEARIEFVDELTVGRIGGTIYPRRESVAYPIGIPATFSVASRRLRQSGATDDGTIAVQRPAPPHLAFLHEHHRRSRSGPGRIARDAYEYIVHDTPSVTVYMAGETVNTTSVDFLGDRATQPYVPELDPSPCSTWYGTHYASIATGIIHGVAKHARFVSASTTNGCLRPMSMRDAFRGLQFVIDHRSANMNAPAVLIVSQLLEVGETDPGLVALYDALVTSLLNMNVTVVSMAGARRTDACKFAPQHLPGVITVGALEVAHTPSGSAFATPWSVSNTGPCVDVWAPGVEIAAASGGEAKTAVMSGTLQASSVVAGVAAELLQRDPTLTPTLVREKLLKYASRGLIAPVPAETTDLVVQMPDVVETF